MGVEVYASHHRRWPDEAKARAAEIIELARDLASQVRD